MDGNLAKKTKKVLKKWGVTEEEAEDFIKEIEGKEKSFIGMMLLGSTEKTNRRAHCINT